MEDGNKPKTRLVIIESPYAGNENNPTEQHLRYLRACMRDCLLRNEAPYASHALYTQPGVLDDAIPAEREHGIQAGFAFRSRMDATIIYGDLGTSKGMIYGVEHANRLVASGAAHTIEYRELGPDWDTGGREIEPGMVGSVFASSLWGIR